MSLRTDPYAAAEASERHAGRDSCNQPGAVAADAANEAAAPTRRRFLAQAGSLFGAAALGSILTASPAEAAIQLVNFGPEELRRFFGRVDRIIVKKSRREMYLVCGNTAIRRYAVSLGSNPLGHKRRQGDGRTPEGRYRIDRRNSRSQFHLSLGVSYPNTNDVRSARSRGVSPGGDIFIHGAPNGIRLQPRGDWTRGCIAVSNRDIEEIWRLVPVGCPIDIYA